MDVLDGWPKRSDIRDVATLRDAATRAHEASHSHEVRTRNSAWKWIREVGNKVPIDLGGTSFQPHRPASPYAPHQNDFVESALAILSWCGSTEAKVIASHCVLCGGNLAKHDLDRGTCHDCRSQKGKLADLNIAIQAPADAPQRIDEWPAIRHLLRQIFRDDISESELWERCTDWLKASGQKDYLSIPLCDLQQMLEHELRRDAQRSRPAEERETTLDAMAARQRESDAADKRRLEEAYERADQGDINHPPHQPNRIDGRLSQPTTEKATPVTEAGNRTNREDEVVAKKKPRVTVNNRMKAELAADLDTVKGWTAQQWANHLGCAKSTVVESPTWKSLSLLRQQAKAERRNDRRRK